jgi:transcriptional regulator with GAF, ATPase, and Fis domain
MIHNAQDDRRHWLVPIPPEVVVSVPPAGLPLITEVAPKIAGWTGNPPEALKGRTISEAFDHILPGLAVVVDEVRTSGTPVRDYRIAFEDRDGVQRTVLLQASLKPGKSKPGQQDVVLRMEEVSSKRALAEPTPEVQTAYGMVGRSAALLSVLRKIEIYGPTEAPVLITGETGTGKEIAARAVHACSRRRHNPFIAVNCSTLVGELLESELFGHEKGAFTGAHRAHRGRFERAHNGTLFLDEIGEMPLIAQAKLLRVLEEGVIERVGGERSLSVDVRLVTATNLPLEWAVQAKNFRLDLYYRLEVLRFHMPPLRERLEDIPLLVEHYLRLFDRQYQRHVRRLTPEALALLQDYSWPGNIRELRNVLERVYVETTTEVIGRKAFDEWFHERSRFFPGAWDLEARRKALAARQALITPYPGSDPVPRPLLPQPRDALPPIDVEPRPVADLSPDAWEYLEPGENVLQRGAKHLTRERIEQAYRRTAGNITQAARYLGIHKATLYRRMKTLGLTREDLDTAVSHLRCLENE